MKRIIETKRLVLREYRVSDSESCFQNYAQDEELGRFLPMYPVKDKNWMKSIIEGFVSATDKGAYIWVITLKDTEECIGNVTVDVPYAQLGVGEIGYLLGSKFWHKGYAYEAVHAVVNYMFDKEKLYLVEAKYNENNTASGRLLKKIGFLEEGRLRDRRIDLKTGERNAMVICSVRKEEVADIQ